MHTRRHLALLAAVCLATGSANATITEFASLGSFLNAFANNPDSVEGPDTYSAFPNSATGTPLVRALVTMSYTIIASPDDIVFGVGLNDRALSTRSFSSTLMFSQFSQPVHGIAGNFFPTLLNGDFVSGSVNLVVTDALGATFAKTFQPNTSLVFTGFTSTSWITSLEVKIIQDIAFNSWPTVDNLYLAAAPAPVPEPSALAMFGLAGLLAVGARVKRRDGRLAQRA